MDSNVKAVSIAEPVYSHCLQKPPTSPHSDQEDSPDFLHRVEMLNVKTLNKELFQAINKPKKADIIKEETDHNKVIIQLNKAVSEIEKKVYEHVDKLHAIDNTGSTFLPGEEDEIEPPLWTQKGTHCQSTAKAREQIIKRIKLETLYKMKVDEEKLIPPSLDEEKNEVFTKIMNLQDFHTDGEDQRLFANIRDCDSIRELLGPDNEAARRYMMIMVSRMHARALMATKKSMEVTLAKLEFSIEQRVYEFNKKTADNMKAVIDAVPKINSKRLYCRNKNCPDCRHTTKPSLATYGLQKPGPRGRKPEKFRKQENHTPLRQYSPSPLRQYSPPPLRQRTPSTSRRDRSYPPRQRTPSQPRRYSPSPPRQRTPSPVRSYNMDPQYLPQEHDQDKYTDYYSRDSHRSHNDDYYNYNRSPSYDRHKTSYDRNYSYEQPTEYDYQEYTTNHSGYHDHPYRRSPTPPRCEYNDESGYDADYPNSKRSRRY